MKIELTDTQCKVLVDALELYSRLGLGQLGFAAETIFSLHPQLHKGNLSEWDIKDEYLDPLKFKLLGFQRGASYGVGNEKVHPNATIAYDMECVLRKDIAEKCNFQNYHVWRADPLHLGKEPLIKILES